MDKRYQVFVSSTFKDLEDIRRDVMEVLIQRKCIPLGMESFPAVDIEQFEFIKRSIDECDFFIVIVAERYGSIDPKDGKGYTEKEYDYAVSKGIPVLAFIKNAEETSDDAGKNLEFQDELKSFRQRLCDGRLVRYWKSPGDLKYSITTSLSEAFRIHSRPGWMRSAETVPYTDNEEALHKVKGIISFEKPLCNPPAPLGNDVGNPDVNPPGNDSFRIFRMSISNFGEDVGMDWKELPNDRFSFVTDIFTIDRFRERIERAFGAMGIDNKIIISFDDSV